MMFENYFEYSVRNEGGKVAVLVVDCLLTTLSDNGTIMVYEHYFHIGPCLTRTTEG